MAKAVFTHRQRSGYRDLPYRRYHFPRSYLNAVRQAVGDWILYYEPRREGGREAYVAVARVTGIDPDPERADHFYAWIEDYLGFDAPVPFREGGTVHEAALRKVDGSTNRGAFGRSVRLLPESEFAGILDRGLDAAAAGPPAHEMMEAQAPFAGPGAQRRIVESLVSRPFRERAFRRQVLAAYDGTCAISGLSLRNGGGWMEVEAAHIMPVEEGGPDDVRNGLALSATLHRMFDRGLVAVAEDLSILVSENKVPREARERLINPTGRLRVPGDPRLAPHPAFLAHHRERRFGGGRAPA
jgi:putative restriction endonuclease